MASDAILGLGSRVRSCSDVGVGSVVGYRRGRVLVEWDGIGMVAQHRPGSIFHAQIGGKSERNVYLRKAIAEREAGRVL